MDFEQAILHMHGLCEGAVEQHDPTWTSTIQQIGRRSAARCAASRARLLAPCLSCLAAPQLVHALLSADRAPLPRFACCTSQPSHFRSCDGFCGSVRHSAGVGSGSAGGCSAMAGFAAGAGNAWSCTHETMPAALAADVVPERRMVWCRALVRRSSRRARAAAESASHRL